MSNTLDNNKMPKHVAIIMDGNGRWATKRLLPRVSGHKAAVNSLNDIIEFAAENKIEALTLFAFGMENWKRPEFEVSTLMTLFSSTLNKELENLQKNNIRFRVIGDKSRLNPKLREKIEDAELKTSTNTGINLNIAISYSGRWDLVEACKKIANQIKLNEIEIDDISEDLISNTLSLGDLPAVDLLIRTSGEFRISNFMLWQLAYAELYFTEVLWPDFKQEDFAKALEFYKTRERRFGKTPEQVQPKETEKAILD